MELVGVVPGEDRNLTVGATWEVGDVVVDVAPVARWSLGETGD